MQVSAYPGEKIKLRITPFDEQNFTAANIFEMRGNLINSVRLNIATYVHTYICVLY